MLRTNPYGTAINVGGGRILRILPNVHTKRRSHADIHLNVPPTAALVKDFLPPPGSTVLWSGRIGETPKPMPPGYMPRDGDVLTLIAYTTSMPRSHIGAYAADAAKYYRDQALARLRAAGRHPVAGTLTVTARLAAGEHPFSVTFLVDGETRGIMNKAPFTMSWDTRAWEDGEHLLEVDGLDEHGRVTTRSKTLIVVQNTASE
ncbi:MAG: Ig-like domain-containing protein [Chthonomonadales bacterium]